MTGVIPAGCHDTGKLVRFGYIEIKEKKALEGVYCINKGYAVFRKVVMIEQNDEYCIVETGTTYGLSQFDYIVRNGNTVKEDDILFK